MVCFACSGYSQGTLAPLYLYTSGDGSITPYQSGQMLEVGQTYDITAVPDAGYEFSSWQPVDVFIFTTTNYNNGVPILPPVVSIVPSVEETNIYVSDLEFTMQDVMQVSSEGSDPDIVRAFGWQADFVAVPEPATGAIFGCGLAAMAVVRRWSLRRMPFFTFCSKSFVTISRQGRLEGVDSNNDTRKLLILNTLRYLFGVS